MKIAQVSPYDHQTPGGVREHVVNLTRALSAAGHDVRIVAPAASAEGLDARVIRVSGTLLPVRINGSVARVTLSPPVNWRIRRIFETERFDVVHVHEPVAPLVSVCAVLNSPTVTIGHFHAHRGRYPVYDLVQALLRRLLARLDARVAVSEAARRGALLYFPGECGLLPDGVDAARFADPTLRPIERYHDGRPNILFVGRADPRKGMPVLLDAFPRVKARIPSARLIIAGAYTADEVGPLAEWARREGIPDVEFVGRVSDEDLPRYFRTSNVFCAPSVRGESLGIVLLEAMASGTPIVASDIEGYHTVLTEGQEGVFVPPGDADALADALVRLMQNSEMGRRMGAEGQVTARRYDWSEIARRTIQKYEACLERTHGRAAVGKWRFQHRGTPSLSRSAQDSCF